MSNQMSRYFNLPNPGLRAYFDHVVKGNSEEYRTTFYRGKSLKSILDGWAPKLNTLQDKWPTLVDFENDLREKVGPMSVMKPLSQRMDDIESYYESVLLDSKPVSDKAVAAVIKDWNSVRGLRIRGQKSTVEQMRKSTNSGSPYFTKRRNVIDKTVPVEVHINKGQVHLEQGHSEWLATATLGWRGQEGGPETDDVKQRVIWMFPFGVNIRELQLYQPLICAAQKHNLIPAWIGMDEVDKRITDMFDSKGKDDLVVCTDFSKFDQHFNSSLQVVASDILSSLLDMSSTDSRNWLINVFPVKYMIPLCYNWNQFKVGAHGMASGSGGTNCDETLSHRALQHEAAILNGSQLNPNSQCLGDDGVLTYPGITVEDVMRSYTAHGLTMNADKQYASKHDCVYLRRWHHDAYRINGVCAGVYSTYRALGRLAEQERYYDPSVWNSKMVALRQLSILENVKYHPLRESFADYCMKGDKYRLGIDIPGFLDNIDSIAQEAIDYMPDFLGYTKSIQYEGRAVGKTGISEWWIVNYLKSKA